MKKARKKLLTGIIVLCIALGLGAAIVHSPFLFMQGYMTYLNLFVETTTFKVEGTVVRMNGEINNKTYDQFVELHKANPQITILYEEVVPGSIDDETMIRLSYYVRQQGLQTMVGCDSQIDSGGVDLFLAGVERIVDCADENVTPHMGVHSWSDGLKDAAEYPRDAPEHENNRKYIEDMLGRDDFYWFTIYAAGGDEMHVMTRAEIDKYDLVTTWR